MWCILSLLVAYGGEVIIDAKIPAHVAVDGAVVAEIYTEGVLRLPLADGRHTLGITTGGTPSSHEIEVGGTPVVVLVGRSGTSIGAAGASAAPEPVAGVEPEAGAEPAPAAPVGPVPVRFRTAGRARVLVQIGTRRFTIAPGAGIEVELAPGEHIVSVRNPDGTQVFARGVLTLTGGSDLVVQVAEGRVPETSGDGVAFYATSR